MIALRFFWNVKKCFTGRVIVPVRFNRECQNLMQICRKYAQFFRNITVSTVNLLNEIS